jgi:hypothetical protein
LEEEVSSEEESVRRARFDDGDTTDLENDDSNNGSDDKFSDDAFD